MAQHRITVRAGLWAGHREIDYAQVEKALNDLNDTSSLITEKWGHFDLVRCVPPELSAKMAKQSARVISAAWNGTTDEIVKAAEALARGWKRCDAVLAGEGFIPRGTKNDPKTDELLDDEIPF